MDRSQRNVTEFMVKAEQTTRDLPTEPTEEEKILRVKLLFEEFLEFADAMGVRIICPTKDKSARVRVTENAEFRCIDPFDMTEAADALADIDYVNYGAAVTMGIDLGAVKEEVHSSNMSKFIDGKRRADGKWVKGPSYKPADVKSVLDGQKKLSLKEESVTSNVEEKEVKTPATKVESSVKKTTKRKYSRRKKAASSSKSSST